jgi:hypothetical protein
VSLLEFLFFLYNNTSYHTVFVALVPLLPLSLLSVLLLSLFKLPFAMARLLTRAEHRAAHGAISRSVRSVAR